jgi:hypothetical protein
MPRAPLDHRSRPIGSFEFGRFNSILVQHTWLDWHTVQHVLCQESKSSLSYVYNMLRIKELKRLLFSFNPRSAQVLKGDLARETGKICLSWNNEGAISALKRD